MIQVYDRVGPMGGLTTLVLLTFIVVLASATLDWIRDRLLLQRVYGWISSCPREFLRTSWTVRDRGRALNSCGSSIIFASP